jgi:hypothetical protein
MTTRRQFGVFFSSFSPTSISELFITEDGMQFVASVMGNELEGGVRTWKVSAD